MIGTARQWAARENRDTAKEVHMKRFAVTTAMAAALLAAAPAASADSPDPRPVVGSNCIPVYGFSAAACQPGTLLDWLKFLATGSAGMSSR